MQLDLAEITSRLRMQDGLAWNRCRDWLGGDLGVRGHDGNAVSVFDFLNGSLTVDERHLNVLELVVPHMHGVLVRVLKS